MKYYQYIKKTIILLLLAALALGLSGCGDDIKAPYRMVGKALYTDGLVLSFRDGDPLGEVVAAALFELAAQGDVAELSAKWLGSRDVAIAGDPGALSSLPQEMSVSEGRVFIMGFDENDVPRAFSESGSYTGFDVELARRLCAKLGWKLRLQPIDAADVKIELNSGNIDCAWGFPASVEDGLWSAEPYLENDVVFAVAQDSGIKRKSHFSDKILYVASQEIKDYIESSEDYSETFKQIRVVSGAGACFDALNAGNCDLVAVDRLALEYRCR